MIGERFLLAEIGLALMFAVGEVFTFFVTRYCRGYRQGQAPKCVSCRTAKQKSMAIKPGFSLVVYRCLSERSPPSANPRRAATKTALLRRVINSREARETEALLSGDLMSKSASVVNRRPKVNVSQRTVSQEAASPIGNPDLNTREPKRSRLNENLLTLSSTLSKTSDKPIQTLRTLLERLSENWFQVDSLLKTHSELLSQIDLNTLEESSPQINEPSETNSDQDAQAQP